MNLQTKAALRGNKTSQHNLDGNPSEDSVSEFVTATSSNHGKVYLNLWDAQQ